MNKRRKKPKEGSPEDVAENDHVVFSKMAPRKVKTQGKRNNIKIKSKISSPKPIMKPLKKFKKDEKSMENLNWLNKLAANGSLKKRDAVPNWLNSASYKHRMVTQPSETNNSEFEEYPPPDPEAKSSESDASEECNCSHSKYPESNKAGILKRKLSSTDSIVANYIKSGMDQVASFIVESAIRFGEQHGVVIPDKNTPNVYEITSPDKKFEEKFRKIRFRIPERTLGYEDAKKLMWRSHNKDFEKSRSTPTPDGKTAHPRKSASWESSPDSLEEILPILEKLKKGGDIVTSDLDLEKLAHSRINQEYERERDHDRERDRERNRNRLREKLRAREKRYKSMDPPSDKGSETEYVPESRWKKLRRDSLELGRRRLRAVTCPRKQDSGSMSPY